MKKVMVACSCCKGAGRVELTGAYLETLQRMRLHGVEVTAAELAGDMDVKPTAMSNRLAALERLGLATSRTYGRKRLYRAKGSA
jgi:Mn-dependent DtxR family transcriptional regulator